jgi:hypothetical protein
MFIEIDKKEINDLIPRQIEQEDNNKLVVGTKNAIAGYMMIGWSNKNLPEWGIEDFSDNIDNQSFYPTSKVKKTNNAYIIRLLGNPPASYDKPYVLYRSIAQINNKGVFFMAIFEWASDEIIPYWVNLPMPEDNSLDFQEQETGETEEIYEEGVFD